MARRRACTPDVAPSAIALGLLALGCTAQPGPSAPSPEPQPEATPPDPEREPAARPVVTKPLTVPSASQGSLHLIARRYGPLRLQRLAYDQLAIRGDLAIALLGADGHFHRAEHDLDNIDLAAMATLGQVQILGGRWPERTFLVGWESGTRAEGTPKIWRRVFDARYLAVENGGFDGATPLLWQYTLAAPWPGGETVAVRQLATIPAPDFGDGDPKRPTPPGAEPVRAFVELVPFGRDAGDAPPPPRPSTPTARTLDTPDSIPDPDTAPLLDTQGAPSGLDDAGLLPTGEASDRAKQPAPSDSPEAPVPHGPPGPKSPADSPEPAPAPVPAASPSPGPPTRTGIPAAQVTFPKLPRKLFPRDMVAAGGSVYVMAPDGAILQSTPKPRSAGKWRTLPDSGIPRLGPDDYARLHAADSGNLYALACVHEQPALKKWDGSAWTDEPLPSAAACPRSVAEVPGGALWLATIPEAGTTLWHRLPGATWAGVELPRIPWVELTWDRWYAHIPREIGHAVWERDPAPGNAPSVIPELRASEVLVHGGAVWVVAYAPTSRSKVPHVVLSSRQPPAAMEFPADAEEGLEAEDRGDVPFDAACSTPFLHLRDLAPEEHGVDVIPPIAAALGARPEFADTALVEVVRRDARRQLGAIWTNGDALDEGFGPLGELGQAVDKLRPDVTPTMLCLIPRVRFGSEVRAR